ncbi:P1 family peptidase [Halobacteriovorax sp. HLS]|uniref:DmpA family aminopeptidase n=1 Tax=Halobacteriovorax sp. HLS TaxID=2234000 RepID=UPI000FDC230A|nr:P1 family peptidase [Halobacteriovorax sp. HLS]
MEQIDLKDLGIRIGHFDQGTNNNITDVLGVKVGHKTLIQGEDVRTGVTVIMPNDQIFYNKFIGGKFILNGAGEVSGLTQLTEWGILETPIALTNTMSVGRVSDAMTKWMSKKYEKIWNYRDVVIPVVGECDDSFLNDCIKFNITDEDVFDAIRDAKSGRIDQGCVGAGTGMICSDLKGGIGSSSRIINIDDKEYTIGVLVQSNFGDMEGLRVNGYPIGLCLAKEQGNYQRRVENYGSIITVIATDMPLSTHQLDRLCKRAALGIGRMGSYAAHGSGEIIVGFSTANKIKHESKKSQHGIHLIFDKQLNLAYQAVIEATEESILNSLIHAEDMNGANERFVPALRHDLLKKYYSMYNGITEDIIRD